MKTRGSVLIVDDEPGLREMLAYELSQEGFEVEAAENGMAAVERLRKRKFDLAITDLKMPGMDGVATLDALRKIDPDIEVIVATGYATVETAVASLKLGAYDYIQKPYDLNDLKALIGRAMEKSHLQGVVALYEASRALLATLNPNNLVTLILELARRVLHTDDAGLVLGDPVAPTATVHRSGNSASAETYRNLAARALEKGPLRVAGDEAQGYAGVGSALAYPLSARDAHLGALVLLRTLPIPPSPAASCSGARSSRASSPWPSTTPACTRSWGARWRSWCGPASSSCRPRSCRWPGSWPARWPTSSTTRWPRCSSTCARSATTPPG